MSPAALTPPVVRTGTVGALLLVASSLLWGCWSLVCRGAEALSSTPLPAARQTVVVVLVMAVVLVPLAAYRRTTTTTTTTTTTAPSSTTKLALLGITDALNSLCFFAALQLTNVAVAILCHYAAPLLVAALAPRFLHEPRRHGTLSALTITGVGLVCVLQPWAALHGDDVVGAALGLLSAGFYAASVLLGKSLVGLRSTVDVAGWPKLVSLPVAVLAAFACTGGVEVEPLPLAVLVGGAVVCGVLPLLLFYAGLQRLPASQAGVLTLVEPLTAVVLSAALLGEALGAPVMVGGVLVLTGVVLVARVAGETT